MSIGEVKATVRQGIQAIEEGRSILIKAGEDMDSAEALARQTINDSRDKDLEVGLQELSKAVREVELTIRRLDAAVEGANAYLAVLR